MEEITNVAFAGTVKVNLPFTLVIVPCEVPLIKTLAPITGSPLSAEVTVPEAVFV